MSPFGKPTRRVFIGRTIAAATGAATAPFLFKTLRETSPVPSVPSTSIEIEDVDLRLTTNLGIYEYPCVTKMTGNVIDMSDLTVTASDGAMVVMEVHAIIRWFGLLKTIPLPMSSVHLQPGDQLTLTNMRLLIT